MSDTTVRVSADTRRRLELARREGESLDDVLRRLADRDRWLGFGALAAEDGRTGEGTRRCRRALLDAVEADLDALDGGSGSDDAGDGEGGERGDPDDRDARGFE
jgi:hypothetical protein